MGTRPATNVFDQVVEVTYPYLGPATNRFVTRQIQHHLNKRPEQLRQKDLVHLIDWFTQAMAHLSEDTHLVKKYSDELNSIAAKKD
jgi:hypothetical protein